MANPKATPTAPAAPLSQDPRSKAPSTDSVAKSSRLGLSRLKDRISDKVQLTRSSKKRSRSPGPALSSLKSSKPSPSASNRCSSSLTHGPRKASSVSAHASNSTANISSVTKGVSTMVISGTSTAMAHSSNTSLTIPVPTKLAKTKPSADIFSANGTRTEIVVPIPKGDDLLIEDTVQLVLCASLLQPAPNGDASPTPHSLSSVMDSNNVQQQWIQFMVDNPLESQHLHGLMKRIVDNFIAAPTKDSDSILEVVLVGPLLVKEHFLLLVRAFLDEFKKSALLRVDILLGLVQLVQDAPAKSLKPDDLTRILQSIRDRLEDPNLKDAKDKALLTLAITVLLLVLLASPVTKLDREKEHGPLLGVVSDLRKDKDPLVRFQAEYTSQLLLAIPHNETKRHELGRRLVGLTGGLLNMSKVLQLELDGVLEAVPDVYENAVGIFNLAKKAFGSDTQERWFRDVQHAEEYVRNGQFLDLNKLISHGPSCANINFQWRVCQLLGEIAAEPTWDKASRIQALILLEEYYKVNDGANRHSDIRRWVLAILRYVSELPFAHFPSGTLHSQGVSNEVIKNMAQGLVLNLKQTDDNFEFSYPLRSRLPLPSSSEALRRAKELDRLIGQFRHNRQASYNESAIYIEPMSKPSLTSSIDISSLKARVLSFIEGEAKVLLILGDSGSGKSTFNKRLEFELWEKYEPRGLIPLFIDLKTITDEKDMIKEHLGRLNLFSEKQLNELYTRQFVLICDGYDERRNLSNLYVKNKFNQKNQWKVRMVISCRSQYLGSDYRDFFDPSANDIYNYHQSNTPKLFEEATIAPFNSNEIREYVRQYIASSESENLEGWNADRYMEAMNKVPKLNDLVTNPFLLRLMLKTLPRIVGSSSDLSRIQVNRVKLYDEYVFQYFQLQSRRLTGQKLRENEEAAFRAIRGEFVHAGISYLKGLAAAVFTKLDGINSIEYSAVDSEPWMKEFFSEENARAKLLRESSPLDISGCEHKFQHRSILEYFFSCRVFEPKKNSSEGDGSGEGQFYPELAKFLDPVSILSIADHAFGKVNLVSEPSILHFLVERVPQSQSFQQQLLRIIQLSRDKPVVGRAAANAITILVRAGVLFNGADLQGIQIPGADLSEAQIDSANLQNADLTGVSFQRTWLRQADIRGANITDVTFGETKSSYTDRDVYDTSTDSNLRSSVVSSNGTKIGVQLEADGIRIYDTSGSRELLNSLKGGDFESSNILAISNCGSYMALSHSFRMPLSVSKKRLPISKEPQLLVRNLLQDSYVPLSNEIFYYVYRASFSPDDQQLATVSGDNVIRIWNVTTDEFELALDHEDEDFHASCLAWFKDGRRIALGGSYQGDQRWEVRLWDIGSGNLDYLGHTGLPISRIAISPDGQNLVAGCGQRGGEEPSPNLYLWNLQVRGSQPTVLSEGTSRINGLTFFGDGQWIVASSSDDWIRVWNVKNGRLVRSWRGEGLLGVFAVNNKEIISTCESSMNVWDFNPTNEFLHAESSKVVVPCENEGNILWVEYSPDGNSVLSRCADRRTVREWNIGIGDSSIIRHERRGDIAVPKITPEQVSRFREFDLSADVEMARLDVGKKSHYIVTQSRSGRWMASGDQEGFIRLWDLQSSELVEVWKGHTGVVECLKFSPTDDQLASCGFDQKLYLWDLVNAERTELDVGYRVRFCYSPSGTMLATCDHFGSSLRVWDVGAKTFKTIETGLKFYPATAMTWLSSDWLVVSTFDFALRFYKIEFKVVQDDGLREPVVTCQTVVRESELCVRSLDSSPKEPFEFVVSGLSTSVYVWRVVEEGENKVRIGLVWGSMPERLCLTDTRMSGVTGPEDKKKNKDFLLKHGVIFGDSHTQESTPDRLDPAMELQASLEILSKGNYSKIRVTGNHLQLPVV